MVQSWAAANFINIPIDDMFLRWRMFQADDEGTIEAMKQAEKELEVRTVLHQALIAGRLYGTGIAVMFTNEAPMDTELNVDRIREGDFAAFHYFDRYDVSVLERDHDLFSQNYGQPLYYTLHPTTGGAPIVVHHSRCLRFDGIRPPTRSGFTVYDQDFGVSNLIPIITSILQDQLLASGISHMSQEASIPVLHIHGLRQILSGRGNPDDATPDEIGAAVNQAKSLYRLLMLDSKSIEDFKRIATQERLLR